VNTGKDLLNLPNGISHSASILPGVASDIVDQENARDPDQELCQRHHPDADDLTEHQLEWFY